MFSGGIQAERVTDPFPQACRDLLNPCPLTPQYKAFLSGVQSQPRLSSEGSREGLRDQEMVGGEGAAGALFALHPKWDRTPVLERAGLCGKMPSLGCQHKALVSGSQTPLGE